MKAFDNEKYKELQKKELKKRVERFGRLYIEVGGKLFDDDNASRVLPGFESDVKMQVFSELSNDLEVIFCINANDIISKKIRAKNKHTYEDELIMLTEEMKKYNLSVCGVVITFYKDHPQVSAFEERCKAKNLSVYHTYYINNYPNDLSAILSDEGFGKNDHVKVTKKLVLVAAPGANSGKLQTCLSQLYNDNVRGIKSFYAKYETFPVWNLPLDNLVNVSYEMVTADLLDENVMDKFHEDAYGISAVNYNRDEEAFPIMRDMLNSISGEEIYKSPTDMGINNVGFAITNDFEAQKAAFEEIARRQEKNLKDFEQGLLSEETMNRSDEIMQKATDLYEKLINKNAAK